MGKHSLLMTLASASLLVSSCGGSDKGGCTLTGHTSFTEYTTAYVTDLDRNPLDSMSLTDGNFSFHVTDSVVAPYPMYLVLKDPKDSLNNLSMPFIVEAGEIRMELDEYIRISGTPQNRGMQQFLDGLQTCKDAVIKKKDLTVEDIRDIFSDFYKQQILLNKDYALGRFILKEYGVHLQPDDRKQVEAVLSSES